MRNRVALGALIAASVVFQLFLSSLLNQDTQNIPYQTFGTLYQSTRNSFVKEHMPYPFLIDIGLLKSSVPLVPSKHIPRSCTSIFAVNVSLDALVKMEIDSIHVASEHDCKLLTFLYESGVADKIAFYSRRDDLLALIQPQSELRRNSFKRLEQLFSDYADVELDIIPSNVMSWEHAIELLPEWQSKSTSYIFFRDDPDIQDRGNEVLIQRVQQNSLCHMYAPVVMQYYLLTKYKGTTGVSTILNTAKYLREEYHQERLARYIMEGKGILSRRFLSFILGQGNVITSINFKEIDDALLKRYGPVLLSMFTVCDDFGVEGRLVYSLDGCNATSTTPGAAPVYVGCDFVVLEDRLLYAKGFETMGRCRGLHSMIIVGVRNNGTSRRFLVQNWWRQHQFLEISQEYLETQPSGGPSVYVVHSAPRAIPASFEQRARRYAEWTHLDTPEMEPPSY